ncbi:MAG: hypothetical protein KA419_18405 [Acidobacteria bacterium]|nr:hypothetical protein [Acidobacteriota bacterium]
MKRADWEAALSAYVTRVEPPGPALLVRTRRAMHSRRPSRVTAAALGACVALNALFSLGVLLAIWGSGAGLLGSALLFSLWLAISQGVMGLLWVWRKDVGRIGLEFDRMVRGNGHGSVV